MVRCGEMRDMDNLNYRKMKKIPMNDMTETKSTIDKRRNTCRRRCTSKVEWRIDMLRNLLAIKFDNMYVDDFSQEEITDMIKYVCTT